MIGNVATKVAALSEEEETSKVHYTSTSSRRILFFKPLSPGLTQHLGESQMALGDILLREGTM